MTGSSYTARKLEPLGKTASCRRSKEIIKCSFAAIKVRVVCNPITGHTITDYYSVTV